VLNVKYGECHPDQYAGGIFTGVVTESAADKKKIAFVYEAGRPEFIGLQLDAGDRWIDQTTGAIVTIEDASPVDRSLLHQRITAWRMRLYR
jgi:hypothetical protein